MFRLGDYIEEMRTRVDQALDGAMPPESEPPELLHRAMRYSVFPGGKRLRPVLCIAAAEACGGQPTDAMAPALALELLHTYTLIHDDLPCMDDDNERRGKPTVHVVFGEANAVLAGDALQALAFGVLAGAPARDARPYPAARLVAELALAAGSRGVVGGQVADIAATGMRPTAADVAFIHLHKTADLFRAATRMGALAAGADDRALAAMTAYGVHLGLAFQIADDLLDRGAQGAQPQELSCLMICEHEEARQQAENHVAQALAALEHGVADRTAPLRALAEFTVARTH